MCNGLKIAFSAQIFQGFFLFTYKAKGFDYFVTASASSFLGRNFLQCGVINMYQTKRRHITEHRILIFHHSEHFKSNISHLNHSLSNSILTKNLYVCY